jgi:hypothetical protein
VAGGIATAEALIEVDLRGRLPEKPKKQRAGLALLAATMLDLRRANLMTWRRPCHRPRARSTPGSHAARIADCDHRHRRPVGAMRG